MKQFLFQPSLRHKLAIAFLLVGLIPLIIGAWMGGKVIERSLIDQAGEQLKTVLALKSAQLVDFFSDRREELDFAINDPDVIAATGTFSKIFSQNIDPINTHEWIAAEKALGGWFERYLKLNHYYDILLLDIQGNVIFSVRHEKDLGQNAVHGTLGQTPLSKVFQRGLQGVVVQDFESYIPSGNQSFVFIAGPIYREGQLQGVMVTQVSRERLNTIMAFHHGLGQTGETYLVGRANNRIGFRNDRFGKGVAADQEIMDHHAILALNGEDGMAMEINPQGGKIIKVYAQIPLPSLNWAIMATKDLQEILSPKDSLLNILLMEALGTALVVLIAAWSVARLFSLPVVHLTAVAKRLELGEWSARANPGSEDELGRMAGTFNRMAQRFETSLWIKSQSNALLQSLQSANTMSQFADRLMSTLTPLMNAEHGCVHLLNRHDGRYELAGPMCFFEHNQDAVGFFPGEGLVGLTAKEQKTRIIERVHKEQVRLRGGLADITPLCLMFHPIVLEGKTLAVLEFAGNTTFGETSRDLLHEVSTLIALTLDNLHVKVDLEHLLEQSQRYRTELEAQAEELNVQKRILEHNNEELIQQGRELEQQQDALSASNEELEQKNRELEQQTEELEQQAEALEKTRLRAEKISQYKTEFLANMSHELRTPLNSLLILARGFAENRDGNLTGEQRQAAEIIHASGVELLQLINGILDLSKIEAGGLQWMVEKIDLHALLRDLETRFQSEARAKSLEFKVVMAPNTRHFFHSDRDKLLRILLNFLANAFKFTRKGSVVLELATTEESDAQTWLKVTVRDTGIGIPPARQEEIFEAFQQGDGSITREFGGTGLGLAIAKRMAHFLGGAIQLQSVEHQGSAFTIRIPEVASAPSPKSLVPADPPPPFTPPVTETVALQEDRPPPPVLIIEDDTDFSRILGNMARERGFTPHMAHSGEEGLAMARQIHPSGILLDLGLPDMDGWQVMDQLKASPATREIPVHIVSAREDGGEGISRGAVGVLTKPVTKEELFHAFDLMGTAFHTQRMRLLLVEDNPHARTAIISLLKEHPLDITQVASGQEAKAMLEQQPFHGMILDLNLPDISGFDLLEQLHQGRDTLPVPVIIHSGRDLTSEEYARLKCHTNAIVTKSHRSEERLLDEVVLFLHRVLDDLPHAMRARTRMAHPHQEEIFKGKRLLLVEDDVRSAFATGKNLEHEGIRVQMVANGQKALETLEKDDNFDAILMDIMMPVMDGLEATRRIRQSPGMKDLPIIALTAKAMNDDRERCLAAGASDYLTKPVDMDRLLAMLKVWFGRQG
ncbi:MAG: response regulator [Magnetococcales bacterium]|nr:response regulator [Magnetococcales bacterium]